jgi:hypothetical protein
MLDLFLRLGAWAVFTAGVAIGLVFPTGLHPLGLALRGVLIVASVLGLMLLVAHTVRRHLGPPPRP